MNSNLPDYETPPVSEVVCGVLFRGLDDLLIPYYGSFWDSIKEKFNSVQEQPFLWPTVEALEGEPLVAMGPPDSKTGFPLPRVWFVTEDQSELLQIQRDRFLFNWRRQNDSQTYPRFSTILPRFLENLELFKHFLEDNNLSQPIPLQYELTYINVIPQGEGWDTPSDLASLFPDFCWRIDEDRFLGTPEAMNWQTQFLLPGKAGRLHITIRSGIRRADNHPIVQFELTTRGFGPSDSPIPLERWFEIGHEWIVRGFSDLTSLDVQQSVWGRKV